MGSAARWWSGSVLRPLRPLRPPTAREAAAPCSPYVRRTCGCGTLPPQGRNGLRGTVAEVSFLGEAVDYQVLVDGGLITVNENPSVIHPVGE